MKRTWIIGFALVVIAVGAGWFGGFGRVDAATADLSQQESVYLGESLALNELSHDNVQDISALVQTVDTGWTDLKWQNDMIQAAGVYAAIDERAQKITAPARFSGSHHELLLSTDANNRYGIAARAAIEAGDPQALNNAAPYIAQSVEHVNKMGELVKCELDNNCVS